jgi:glycogen operon protein
MRAWPGKASPLGATWDGEGVNFALFSENATRVDLCLFARPEDGAETARVPLAEREDGVWHAYLPDARPGLLYAYRVDGPFAPESGHRFNPHKLLLDPYALAISHTIVPADAVFGYPIGDPRGDLVRDTRDSAAAMAKCVVIDGAFTWGDDRPPRTPWSRTLIYECHVKGLTVRHPDLPQRTRGLFLGVAADPIIEHLLALGVTAVELLPVQHCVSERRLVERGLTNFWGYNTIGFFAPDSRFASGGLGQQVAEFKSMVKRLHRAGIEVILDVVYNHTAEGNHLGPTLSLRGIDNATYYRLDPADPRRYVDVTGCGNTLNVPHPRALQLVLDSLRYWVREMHVDGFRFDLAPALAREPLEMNRLSRFFTMIRQDPILSEVKLIAEPWDAGPNGFQLGNFPGGWAEWNAKYRDGTRRFWRGEEGCTADLAHRLGGSSDLFGARGGRRGPRASVNYVTCHDGPTLHDLVTYEAKYNEANGEGNEDGPAESFGRNWGAEGPTDSPAIVRARERAKRNLLATLAFSQGVPMIGHGDEIGRTQRGNTNAYCQDNEVSWVDWNLDARRRDLLDFTARVFAARRANPVLRRRTFFRGDPIARAGAKDVTWVRADGRETEPADWNDPRNHVLGMLIHGDATDEVDERGRTVRGRSLLLWVNGGGRARRVTLPAVDEPGYWSEVVNTARRGARAVKGRDLALAPHSLVLLERGSEP